VAKHHYERWTEGEIDSVFFLRSQGKTHAEIAKILGRSASAVTNVVFRERKRNSASVDSMIGQTAELRQNVTREELMKELLPGLNALFGSELEKYEDHYSEMMKPPTIFERIKRWFGSIKRKLGIGR
jgi:predicted transcriptional regulator